MVGREGSIRAKSVKLFFAAPRWSLFNSFVKTFSFLAEVLSIETNFQIQSCGFKLLYLVSRRMLLNFILCCFPRKNVKVTTLEIV